ncbi:50S ribosomal protein L37e [Blastomyces dermatitidis ER-3]|uniref:Ribosomal protein L37e n=2 Tax=Blastomyces TaxID=229219 RepID=A0A179UAG9_BLAGS|nr:ribosomal protein L37e [Blastomyces gilchristii SLH14081]XP_045277729.1 50S ribosomal protein L37e [Blastomyces dermatitidis ER-3]EEQ91138.2 50S ribosomal protein L37e [Blastomyces dermatitidis ER-3]OAT04157.1 ribosomal protein L37e [Blastomyces gilchristii SLH14081]
METSLKEEIKSRVGFKPYTTIRLATSGRDENFRSNARRRQRRQRPALVDAEFQSLIQDEELPALASAITNRTLCADVAAVALSTSRSTHARLAGIQPLRPGNSTGPRRVCDEEPPELDACDISRRSTANSRTDSKPAPPRELGGQRSIKLLRG